MGRRVGQRTVYGTVKYASFAPQRKEKEKTERAQNAADRALELLDFTVSARTKAHESTRELLRLREVLCDYFYGDNQYASTNDSLNKYFDPFSMKAARQRHK